jgi:hypothetical protein
VVSSRTATALVGVLLSLALSAALWYYLDSLLFLLFVPFVPFLLRGTSGGQEGGPGPRSGPEVEVAECPVCGYSTTDPAHDYCPRDGTRLERRRADAGRR